MVFSLHLAQISEYLPPHSSWSDQLTVTSFLIWTCFNWGPICVVNVLEKVLLHLLLLFLPLCNEPHCYSFSSQSWFIATSHFFFIQLDFQVFSPFHFTLQASFTHSSAALEEHLKAIFCHYSGDIYTTLSKLHLAHNMFQRLSTPHSVAGGLASIKCNAAKTGRMEGEWPLVVIVLLFPQFCILHGLHFHRNCWVMLHVSTGVNKPERVKTRSLF